VPLPGHTPAEMRDAIHKEIDKLKTADVTDDELQMYKTGRAPTCCAGWPTTRDWPTRWPSTRRAMATGANCFKQLDKVDKVTKADIRRVANKVFVASNRTTAEIDTEAPAGGGEERWRRAMKSLTSGQWSVDSGQFGLCKVATKFCCCPRWLAGAIFWARSCAGKR
jgi:hypothetical protein